MKSIELRRHAERSVDGMLTKNGIEAAKRLGATHAPFSKVVASDSARAQLTAQLITGIEPRVDSRAAVWMTDQKNSDEINKIALEKEVSFLEAMQEHGHAPTLHGTMTRADELNELITQLFDEIDDGEQALIISHDLSINAAMTRRELPLEIIDPLEGYVIYEDGKIYPATLQ